MEKFINQESEQKFCFLLGDFRIIDQNKIEISIDAVLEGEPEENFYKEGIEEIHNINMPLAIKMAEEIQKMPESKNKNKNKNKNYKLIGDIHTHPCKPSYFEEDFVPWVPSEGDVESMVENYKKNVLKDNSPYIFGIAAPNESGETLYAYYRIIRNGDSYSYVKI